ncbi:hypothetical protein TKK_0004047 [Trichogramma kaykai]
MFGPDDKVIRRARQFSKIGRIDTNETACNAVDEENLQRPVMDYGRYKSYKEWIFLIIKCSYLSSLNGVKEEANDTLTTAGDDYNLDSVDPCEPENSEILPFYELSAKHVNKAMASHKSSDENVFIDFECKVQPTSLSATICKSEYKNVQSIVKIEKENPINDTEENILIDFECKDVKVQPTSLTDTICKSEYQNVQAIVKVEKENPINDVEENILIDFECKDVKVQSTSLTDTICKSEYQNVQAIVKVEKENPINDIEESILIDFECKDVKIQPTSLTDTICKSEYQNVQAIVKVEKENPINDIEESILIDFECKDVKFELESQSAETCKSEYRHFQSDVKKGNKKNLINEISPIILIKRGFNYDNGCQINKNSHLKLTENKKLKNVHNIVEKKSSLESKVGQTNELIEYPKKHTNIILRRRRTRPDELHNQSKPFKCDICDKSFKQKSNLTSHIHAVHDRIKPFECEICHKSFPARSHLKRHIMGVHKRIKRSECEICHKSFSDKGYFKTHLNFVIVSNHSNVRFVTNHLDLRITFKGI